MKQFDPIFFTAPSGDTKRARTLHKGGGGGGGSSTTTGTTYTTNIPEYARPYVESMLGAGQAQIFKTDGDTITGFNPYKAYSNNPADYFAPASPMQKASYSAAAGLTLPGQFGTATGLETAGGLGALGAGANYAQMATSPGSVQAYMNPYLKASLDPQLEAIQRQYDITAQQQKSAATGAGAFGGSREAIMAAENQRAANAAKAATIAQGYNTAFQNAQQAQQFGANLGLQGYGQAVGAGSQLGQLGTAQLAGQQGIINTQNILGGQQQQMQQDIINQAIQNYATQQEYPMMALANMNALLRGLPLQNTSTQTYAAAPSTLSTIAGLGTGIAGISSMLKAEGGIVKSYKSGGVASLANREAIAEDLSANQLKQTGSIPDYIKIPLIEEKVKEAQQAQAIAAAQEAQGPQQTIKDMVMAQAAGIDQGSSNLPTTYAGGGIVAFEDGGQVQRYASKGLVAPTWDYTPTPLDYSAYEDVLKQERNPATGQPWTREEIAARNRAEETAMGIKDYTESRIKNIEKQRADLATEKEQALGRGLLAASEQLLSAPGNTGFGKGLGAFGTTYGAGLKEVKATARDIDKQEMAAQDAQQAMLQARLAGDRGAYNEAKKDYNTANTNLAAAKNENTKAVNAAKQKGAELGFDYKGKENLENIQGAYKVEAAKAGISPFAGGAHATQALTDRNTLINKGLDDLNKEYETAMSSWRGKSRDQMSAATQQVYDQYMAKKTAIINSVKSQYDPLIKGQLQKLGKTDDEILAIINAIGTDATQAKSSATPGVIEYNADGTRKKT
jgi:hypothetical protein